MNAKPYFPMFVDLSEKKVIVVGAGTIAKRRIRTLIEFTNDLTVIAPEVNPELKQMEADGLIKIRKKHYEREDLFGADLVIAASTDSKENNDIYVACRCLGIIVNVANDRSKCDFFFPAIARDGYTVAGISSSGKGHGDTKRAAEQIQKMFEEER